ncbi:MAG: polysaccharide deacetylase family protein, partial [Chroococcidiopsidaceae cyanobacterium CP_BM_ER_R8_30]|nr:polysaccharide deacetylase family protein [Chroococcidiopsidaceae cyanobacterium CP_BM_ER_R8_30]
FWIGRNVKNFPEIAKLVVDAGHVIGNHTWHHWYKQMDATTAAHEIEDTAAQIYETVGVRTELFRPPGGFLKNGPAGYAEKRNYAVMMWSADSRDWHFESPQVLIRNVLKEAQPGGIVLMHDGGGNRSKTVKALPQIISDLRKRGYKFVTVPELLALRDKELKGMPVVAPATTGNAYESSSDLKSQAQEPKLKLAPSNTTERAARKSQKAQNKHLKKLLEG